VNVKPPNPPRLCSDDHDHSPLVEVAKFTIFGVSIVAGLAVLVAAILVCCELVKLLVEVMR
jgi:hypothetical protein